MLSLEQITHTYGRGNRVTPVLKGINAQFPEGITALLGPNGAGKSTLMNIIGTNIAPTGGRILINGSELTPKSREEYRANLGIVPQHINLPSRMRLEEVLRYLTWVHKLPSQLEKSAIDRVLESVQLEDKRFARIGELSGGQLRRAGFACALLHQPKLLLLDEPTVGLDPQVRLEIRHLISQLSTTTTIIVSTHLLEDVNFLRPRVLLINRGSQIFHGEFEEFLAELPTGGDTKASSVENAYQYYLNGDKLKTHYSPAISPEKGRN